MVWKKMAPCVSWNFVAALFVLVAVENGAFCGCQALELQVGMNAIRRRGSRCRSGRHHHAAHRPASSSSSSVPNPDAANHGQTTQSATSDLEDFFAPIPLHSGGAGPRGGAREGASSASSSSTSTRTPKAVRTPSQDHHEDAPPAGDAIRREHPLEPVGARLAYSADFANLLAQKTLYDATTAGRRTMPVTAAAGPRAPQGSPSQGRQVTAPKAMGIAAVGEERLGTVGLGSFLTEDGKACLAMAGRGWPWTARNETERLELSAKLMIVTFARNFLQSLLAYRPEERPHSHGFGRRVQGEPSASERRVGPHLSPQELLLTVPQHGPWMHEYTPNQVPRQGFPPITEEGLSAALLRGRPFFKPPVAMWRSGFVIDEAEQEDSALEGPVRRKATTSVVFRLESREQVSYYRTVDYDRGENQPDYRPRPQYAQLVDDAGQPDERSYVRVTKPKFVAEFEFTLNTTPGNNEVAELARADILLRHAPSEPCDRSQATQMWASRVVIAPALVGPRVPPGAGPDDNYFCTAVDGDHRRKFAGYSDPTADFPAPTSGKRYRIQNCSFEEMGGVLGAGIGFGERSLYAPPEVTRKPEFGEALHNMNENYFA
ncbi:unnamed protein product [Amoebophrya sp. A120]|nr:unnamed protein product [Amoebophrya sp. A120]|eukprot:GSA120T00010889001.1